MVRDVACGARNVTGIPRAERLLLCDRSAHFVRSTRRKGKALYRRAFPSFFATRKNSPLCGALKAGDFAVCGRRPEGSALWTPAAFEKAGETFTAYGGVGYGCYADF